MTAGPAISVRNLRFAYRGDPREVLGGVSLDVAPGRRVLVIGANGAGKTTLLRIIGGKHMVAGETVQVVRMAAFHEPRLAGGMDFLGRRFPFELDLRVDEILARQLETD